jgi:phosphoribosylglycinamide formyltransferase 2
MSGRAKEAQISSPHLAVHKTDANVFVYTARNFFRGIVMIRLGTALRPAATRVMLLGSGELGKEVAIECQRLGVEVIAVDRYADAPAMHVAHRSYVINMLDGDALRELISREKPDFVVPEIEAIATDTLIALEQEGQRVVPCAKAAKLTMNREGIRRLAAEELGCPRRAIVLLAIRPHSCRPLRRLATRASLSR